MFTALAAVIVSTGCNDELDLGLDEWDARVDTVTIYTVDRPEFQGLPAAFDAQGAQTRRVEDPAATGNWDFVLTGGVGGEPLAIVPLGAFFDVVSQAGIASVPGDFTTLDIAPADDDDYTVEEPVVLDEDALYVVRTRQFGCAGSAAVVFAKIEPLDVDQAAGTFTFRSTTNPICNDRALIPPEDD